MNDTQSAEDLDLDAIAESWLGTPAAVEETEQPEEPAGDGGEPASPEPANAAPPPQATITPEQEEEIYNRRLNAQLARAREAKEQRDLNNMLATGTAEEIAEWTKNQIAEASQRAATEALTSEAAANAEVETIMTLLDADFINNLSEQEAQTLLPENFSDTKTYIKAIADMRAQKASSGLFNEDEVERRVQERLKGQQNAQRGQQFRQSTPSALPPSSENSDKYAGLDGSQLKDALWGDIAESWDSDNS